mgnify:CR=1 FL=1
MLFTRKEIPENKNFGHYSTNVALKIAKRESKNPIELATHIAQVIKKGVPKGMFETIEAVPPGFINFRLSGKILHQELKNILEKKEEYGKGKKRRGEKKSRKSNDDESYDDVSSPMHTPSITHPPLFNL